jgi:hypothetical protein
MLMLMLSFTGLVAEPRAGKLQRSLRLAHRTRGVVAPGGGRNSSASDPVDGELKVSSGRHERPVRDLAMQ